MDIPLEIMKNLKPLNPENFVALFLESKFVINKKHLLILSLEQTSLAKAILQNDPNAKYVFTSETLALFLEEEFSFEKFSKKEILNIFANQNSSLVTKILDLNIFDKIYIINDIEDYEAEALNIRQGSDLSFNLLEKNCCEIKYLINSEGEINPLYLDHLKKCISLMDPEKIIINDNDNSPQFILNLDKSSLQKIMKKFNVKKFLHFIYDQFNPCLINQQHIENLIFLNGDFIDSRILALLMNNYTSFDDENHEWIKNLFKFNEYYFTNYNIAKWISENIEKYKNYKKIEEFHNYSFHNQKIYDYFYKRGFFVEKLTEFPHLVSFLMVKLESTENLDEDGLPIICKMIEYILENRLNVNFEKVASQPEKILFKIKEYGLKEEMSEEFLSKDFEIRLKFKNHDITTTLMDCWKRIIGMVCLILEKKWLKNKLKSIKFSA